MDIEQAVEKAQDLNHGKVTKSATEVLPSVRTTASPGIRDPLKTPSPPKVSIPSIHEMTQSQVQGKPRVYFRAPFSETRSASNTFSNLPPNSRCTPSSGYFSRNYRPPGVQSKAFEDTDDISTKLKRLEDMGLLQKIKSLQLTKALDLYEDEEEDEEEEEQQKKNNPQDEGERKSTVSSDGTGRKPLGPSTSSLYQSKATSKSSPNICHPTIDRHQAAKYKAPLNLPEVEVDNSNSVREKIEPLIAKIRASKSDPDISSSFKKSSIKSGSKSGSRAESSSSIASQDMDSKDLKKIRVKGRQYLLLGLIGTGGSAKVYHVFDQLTEQNLALKVVDLRKADESTRAGYTNEINLLERLSKCKRVVRLVAYENRMDKSSGQVKTLLLIMEKGDTDLANLLKGFLDLDSKYSLDPHLVKHYWREMLVAVNEIHSMDVVHSDLKPVNFITVAGKLKLIDFGIANAIQSDHTSVIKDSQVGTINYMAPEALNSRPDLDPSEGKSGKPFIKFNSKADIWSLGCILYNLLYGKPPFAHCSTLIQKIQAICNPRSVITYRSHPDKHAVDCVKKCLERDPRKRPTAEELLRHPYLTSNQSADCDSNRSQNPHVKNMVTQINDLTPNRMRKLSSFLHDLAATKLKK